MLVPIPVRFVLVGIVGASIEIVAYLALLEVGFFYLICNLVGYHLAIISTFFLQSMYTFPLSNTLDRHLFLKFFKYILFMHVQLAIGSVLLLIFVELLLFNEWISKFIQMSVVVPVSYLGQKIFIFRGKNR